MPEKTQTPKTRRWPFLALAASAFALVMTVGPIVATSGVDAGGSEQSHAGYNVGMMAARSAIAAAQSDAPSIDSAASDDEPVAIPASPVVAPIVDAGPDPVIEPVATEPPAIREDDAIDIILELSGDDITDRHRGTVLQPDNGEGGQKVLRVQVGTGQPQWITLFIQQFHQRAKVLAGTAA